MPARAVLWWRALSDVSMVSSMVGSRTGLRTSLTRGAPMVLGHFAQGMGRRRRGLQLSASSTTLKVFLCPAAICPTGFRSAIVRFPALCHVDILSRSPPSSARTGGGKFGVDWAVKHMPRAWVVVCELGNQKNKHIYTTHIVLLISDYVCTYSCFRIGEGLTTAHLLFLACPC